MCKLDNSGNNIFIHGQSYVASSRVANLNYVYIINFDFNSVNAYSKSIQEYNRLRKNIGQI